MNLLISLVLAIVIVQLTERLLGVVVPGWAVVGLYLVLYWGIGRWQARGVAEIDEPNRDLPAFPVSGPVARLGNAGVLAIFFVTNFLSVFNPFQFVQVVRQLWGNERLLAKARKTGSDGRAYRTKIRYQLPLSGEWVVINGGNTPKTSHSWSILGQRFALDLVQADGELRRHKGTGRKAEDYFCYGQEVLAAADGTVVLAQDGIAQAPGLGWAVCDFTARHFAGNHLLIEHAPGEYGFYAHLIKDSLCVQPGDRVKRGQLLGHCGHSGHSTEPHLHFHLQDSADLFQGMGLPVTFSNIILNGRQEDGVQLYARDRVKNRH